MVDFYEIRKVYVKNANDLLRVITNPKVVDYHLCKNIVCQEVNLFTGESLEFREVILVLEAWEWLFINYLKII